MLEADRKIWADVLSHLRTSNPELARRWFDEIQPVGLRAGAFELRTQHRGHADYLARNCLDALNEAAQAVTGRLISVRIIGPDDIDADSPSDPTQVPAAASGSIPMDTPADGAAAPAGDPPPPRRIRHSSRPLGDEIVLSPDYTFETFVVGPNNRLAHAAALAICERPGKAYNPMFVHGGVGLGKTHLLQAVCQRVLHHDPQASILYISCEGFVTRFMSAVRDGEMESFRHRFRDVDVLVIDDIHFLGKRDRTQEEFFHTFNELYQSQKQIILSSDAPPSEIPDLEERLVSRFQWGLVAPIDPPDYETRVEIVKAKARMRAIKLPDNVACFIASRIDANIRELEGAIIRLQMQSVVEKRDIDLAMVRDALGAIAPDAPRAAGVTIQHIVDCVTEYYGVSLTHLQSKRRQRSIAEPRQVCMFLARKLTRYSLEEIGGYFGGRDHTTVLHAVRTIEARKGHESDLAARLAVIDKQILGLTGVVTLPTTGVAAK